MNTGVAPAQSTPEGQAPLTLRVLVVDDTPDIRLLLRLALERDTRFEVIAEAGDGLEAIEAAARLQPDLVLLDLAMPVMDGLEALPGIRSGSPDSTIVVLSGFDAREMRSEALRLGATSYLEKGDIANRLIPHILSVVDHRPEAQPLTEQPAPIAAPAAPPPPVAPPPGSADYMSDEWVSVLAHELNNPVTILQGFAKLLQEATDEMSPASIKESAAAIGRSAKHLGALVEAFADLRRIEVDALDLVVEPTDISALVRDLVTDMAEITATHPVVLELVDGVIASVDPPRIRQVLINLLANAAKFAPPNTRIDVRVTVAAGKVEVSVRDHGPGIETSNLSAMFRKFSRLDPHAPGTGIGLFLSRGIARAHGGDLVLAESAAPGCRFVLRLPLVRGVKPPSEARLAASERDD